VWNELKQFTADHKPKLYFSQDEDEREKQYLQFAIRFINCNLAKDPVQSCFFNLIDECFAVCYTGVEQR
jgi:hypothetical protein